MTGMSSIPAKIEETVAVENFLSSTVGCQQLNKEISQSYSKLHPDTG